MDSLGFDSVDIILVCGLPGAGKSHFSRAHFRESERKRVNRREIRRHLYEMLNFGKEWSEDNFDDLDEFLVKHVERKILEQLLHDRQKLVVDNICVTEESRKAYVDLAGQMNRSIGVIFLNTPAKLCLQRNVCRQDPVPGTVITNLSIALELPDEEENFKQILILSDY